MTLAITSSLTHYYIRRDGLCQTSPVCRYEIGWKLDTAVNGAESTARFARVSNSENACMDVKSVYETVSAVPAE